MPFTLDKLANALRGIPRDAVMLVRLPDGTLRQIDHLEGAKVAAGGGGGGRGAGVCDGRCLLFSDHPVSASMFGGVGGVVGASDDVVGADIGAG